MATKMTPSCSRKSIHVNPENRRSFKRGQECDPGLASLVPALEGKGDGDHVFHVGTPSNKSRRCKSNRFPAPAMNQIKLHNAPKPEGSEN